MGRRGPAPEPTKLKVLKGNPGRRPLNEHEPEPTGNPVKPAGMSAPAELVWDRHIADYGHTGVLSGVDAEIFRVYCEAVVRYTAAAQTLERTGPLVKGRYGALVRNPLHQVVRDNADLIRITARELGFTPSSRSALTSASKNDKGDELDRWAASK